MMIKKSNVFLEQASITVTNAVNSLYPEKQLKIKLLSSSKKGALLRFTFCKPDGEDIYLIDEVFVSPESSIEIKGIEFDFDIKLL